MGITTSIPEPIDGNSAVVTLSNSVTSLPVSPFTIPRPTDELVKKAKIVVVDDELIVAELVAKYLRDGGFRYVSIITDPTKAIAEIPTLLPDLVMLDLRMQPVNGLEILEFMRSTINTRQIPVIVLTSDKDESIKVTALNMGANDFLTKPVFAGELCSRVRNTLSERTYRNLVAEFSVHMEADLLSDAQTGVANRRAFEYETKRRIAEWNRLKTPFGVLMIDVDDLSTMNDQHGKQDRDQVLRNVADILTRFTRELNLVARYGDDEFAMLLPSACLAESQLVAVRTRQLIESKLIDVGESQKNITLSIGLANVMDGDDANLLIHRADCALDGAKQHGRNCCCFHDGESCHKIVESEDIVFTNMRDRNKTVEQSKIVIVDDEPLISVVRKYLNDAGFKNVVEITDSNQAFDTITRENPDLVLLDIRMPNINGIEIMQDLRNRYSARPVPVLIFTSSTDKQTKVEALELGARDFLQKPVEASELLARVRNTLLAKSHLDNLSNYSARLEQEVRRRTAELSATRREAIQCLARAAELRDDQTGQHVLRVGRYAAIIAIELGFSEERAVWIEHAAQLHDVGKIGIPDAILYKPGKLTEAEWDVMKSHCLAGIKIMQDEYVSNTDGSARPGPDFISGCNSPIMKMALVVAQTHHEKWDGSGYPRGLSGTDIPIEGRIAAVADVFDALSTKRSYKEAMPLDQCFTMLEEGRNSHFDPAILDAFFRKKSDIVRTFYEYVDVDDECDSNHDLNQMR